jgi:hypothetical protein
VALKALGKDLSLGMTGQLLTTAVSQHAASCQVLPIQAFSPFEWRETWLLLDPDERVQCELRAASSYCVHWWNTALAYGLGLPKTALPPEGSYLHARSQSCFGTAELPTWPLEPVKTWIRNFRALNEHLEKAQQRTEDPTAAPGGAGTRHDRPGSSRVQISRNIVGNTEKASLSPDGRVTLSGWALDTSCPSEPVTVVFFHNGRAIFCEETAGQRPDILEAFPSLQPRDVKFHGRATLDAPCAPNDPSLGLALGASGSLGVIGYLKVTAVFAAPTRPSGDVPDAPSRTQ